MSINFEKLKEALNSTKLPVTRDVAKKDSAYPYIVYSNVSVSKKNASGKLFRKMPYYQVSFFTAGTEQSLVALEKAFKEFNIPYSDFVGIQGDENDDTITNYYTYVRCVENG